MAKYILATQARPAHDYAACRVYLRRLSEEIEQIDCLIGGKVLTETIHEVRAYGRLLTHVDAEQLDLMRLSVRRRITHPTSTERATVGIWRALWAGLLEDLPMPMPVIFGETVIATMDTIARIIREATRSIHDRKGGLAMQRAAWHDADQ